MTIATAAIPLYRQIKDDIKSQIDTGKLKAGDKIPSVNNITQKYSVSAITAVRVFKELSRENYACHEKGKGYFVTTNQENVSSRKLHGVIGCITRPYRATSYDNYFNEVNAGIQQEAMKYNWDILYPSFCFNLKNHSLSPQSALEIGEKIISIGGRVDALILDERIPDFILAEIIGKLDVPCVVAGRKTEVAGIQSFVPAYRIGLENAIKIAVKSSYKNFIICRHYANYAPTVAAIDRACEVLEQATVSKSKINIIENCFSKNVNMIEILLDIYNKILMRGNERTLIVCESDSIARHVCDKLIAEKIFFDDKLGIIGLGGNAYSTMIKPQIATVDIKPFEFGNAVIKWIFKELNQQWEPADEIKPVFEIKFGETF